MCRVQIERPSSRWPASERERSGENNRATKPVDLQGRFSAHLQTDPDETLAAGDLTKARQEIRRPYDQGT